MTDATPSPTQAERARDQMAREVLEREIKACAERGNIGPAMYLCGMTEEVAIAAMLAFAEQSRATDRIAVVEECAAKVKSCVVIIGAAPYSSIDNALSYAAEQVRTLKGA